jgi:hypothetical protein
MIAIPTAADAARDVAGRTRLWREVVHFDGAPVGPVPRVDGAEHALRRRLADHLYARWFTRSWSPLAWPRPATPLPDRLHRAHASARRHEPGWVALGADAEGVVAIRSGQPTRLPTAEVRNLTDRARPPRPGDSLAVIAPRDGVDATGGWWTAWSAPPPTPLEVRLYWHSDPDHVEPLVAALTATLEDAGTPYSMKVPSHEGLFGRVDAGVVYMPVSAWRQVKPALKATHARCAGWLGDAVPPCTLRLGRGVAVAQDPLTGESFGQSRAGAVADGIVDAVMAGEPGGEAMEARIVASMARRGIALSRPYLTERRDVDDALWHW